VVYFLRGGGIGIETSCDETAAAVVADGVEVRSTDIKVDWAWASVAVRLPPQTLRLTTAGRMACSARHPGQMTDVSGRGAKHRRQSRVIRLGLPDAGYTQSVQNQLRDEKISRSLLQARGGR